MRTLVTVTIPVEAGNQSIKDGTLAATVEKFMTDFKPEAAYFLAENGERTMLFVLDLPDSSWIPSLAEPFFMALNAGFSAQPVMNVEDLQAGLQRLFG